MDPSPSSMEAEDVALGQSGGAAPRPPDAAAHPSPRAVCVASRAASDSESRRLRRRPRLFDQRCCRLSLRRRPTRSLLRGERDSCQWSKIILFDR